MVFCREGCYAWLRLCVLFKAIIIRSALKTHSYSIILSGWAVVCPDTPTPSLPLCPEVCLGWGGGGVQGSAACDQNFSRHPPPCVLACRGFILMPLKFIPPCVGPLNSGGIHHGTQRSKRRGMQPNFCQGFPTIFEVVNVVLLPPASALYNLLIPQ